ncbi:MAG: hypothetical protein HOO86_00080 [Bacteroidales bacterium]|nr:hypothetical protein [Bacteroidales bacterium]
MKASKLLLIFVLILSSCSKESGNEAVKTGPVLLKLTHTIEGKAFSRDSLIYLNTAGNQYLVSNIQWFISEIEFIKSDGTILKPVMDDGIFYVDTDLPQTCSIHLDEIPSGNYSAIKYTFGLDEASNSSYRFVNPPESFMFWPEYLGGGYHYMKLNGKWINKDGLIAPFNFHLGIGQINNEKESGLNINYQFGYKSMYDHCEGFNPPFLLPEVSSFVQNYFEVSQDLDFIVDNETESFIKIEMQIDKWFDGSHVYNHDDWGGSIMQQQNAQEIARENGLNVFRLSIDNN